MPTTQTIPIDLNTRGANPVAFTHQGDTARAFAFEVYNNGVAFALTGYTAQIGAILPADRGYTVIAGNDMATGSISENTITATLPAAYTAKAGHGLLTIILTGSGGTLRPINIDLRIQKSADGEDVIEGASDFPEGLEDIAESVFQEYLSTYLPPVAPSSSAAANKAADAKLTGEALDDLKSDLNYYHTAPSGYILRATAGGRGSEWAMFGTPTDAQTATAINAWLNAHPEATTTVQDGSLTSKKFGAVLSGEVKTLSSFDGETDEQRLYDALITKAFKGTILCGNITINTPISIPSTLIREVKLANAIVTLNSDMFMAQSESIARLPSFVNCKFVGNGYSIYGSDYAVFGGFINCSFSDCSLINNDSGTVQSAYLAYCEVLNNTVPLIKANNLFDCRLDGLLCERQNATLIDTSNSTGGTNGARSLWVENSTFEGFQSTVFNLAGGGPGVYVHNCYFEANANGCLKLKKSSDGHDYLMLEISGCKVNSEVTPFEISGFTNNYRVKVSIHDNYYYTSVTGTPMISGIPIDNEFAIYNNRPSYQTDIISDTARYPYDASVAPTPTTGDSTKFSIRAGSVTQIGALVFLSGVIRVETAITSAISNALTGLPRSRINAFRIPLYNADSAGVATDKYLYLNGTSASFNGGSEANVRYYFNAMYFTDNKIVM